LRNFIVASAALILRGMKMSNKRKNKRRDQFAASPRIPGDDYDPSIALLPVDGLPGVRAGSYFHQRK
jgi:hypothetical protein